MADEKRILSFENSMSLYRSKTAMILGVMYFSKGYQSTPVIGMQFAECNDPSAEQKTFNWDTEEKVWYFPTYDKCYELYKKLGKWRQIIEFLKKEKNTDNNDINARFKEYAESHKISNPVKKKTLYIAVRYYNGYLLTITLGMGKDNRVSVSLYEDEFDMILQYIGDFVKNYHNLSLSHRLMTIMRGASFLDKPASDGSSTSQKASQPSNRGSSGGGKSNGSSDSSKSGSKSDDVESLLSGNELESLMGSINTEDIPF